MAFYDGNNRIPAVSDPLTKSDFDKERHSPLEGDVENVPASDAPSEHLPKPDPNPALNGP